MNPIITLKLVSYTRIYVADRDNYLIGMLQEGGETTAKLWNYLCLSPRIQLQEMSRERNLSFERCWLAFEKNVEKEKIHNLLVCFSKI